MSRIALPALSALTLLTAVGCIQHHPVAEGEMDRLWTLSPDPTRSAETYRPDVGGTKLPARWIIRSEPSLLRSTISIVRAVDAIGEGAEIIDVSVSPEHAEVLAGVLADTRGALTGLEELSSGSAAVDYADWADTLAHVLAQLESVSRMAVADGGQAEREPAGISAAPLLELLVVYINEQSGGSCSAGSTPMTCRSFARHWGTWRCGWASPWRGASCPMGSGSGSPSGSGKPRIPTRPSRS